LKKHTILSGFKGLFESRYLLQAFVVRDIKDRHQGTILGAFWMVLQPLMMLAVYSFVFTSVFNTRWGEAGVSKDFVVMLYCGLIVHAFFSETLSRSHSAVSSNQSYVKKVVFPLEILPFIHLVSAVFNLLIGLLLICVYLLIQNHAIPLTAIYVLLVLVPLIIITAGFAWILAAVGVFFRDIGHMIGLVMSILLFLSPVFYPVSAAPTLVQNFLYLNPLTFPIEQLRLSLILGNQPDWEYWIIYFVVATVFAISGLWVFQKVRPAFADII
jgi:lipopolysaccharide transport system permease protein